MKTVGKRLLSSLLIVVMIFSAVPVTALAEDVTAYYFGDINKDNVVNAKDVNLIKRAIAGVVYYENGSYEFTASDLDRDKTLTAKDSNLLIKTVIGDLSLELMEPWEPEEPERTEPLAPDFTVYDEMGNEVRLSDYIGKPVVINFWTSWCSPCKKEMPDFYEKYLELGDEVQFLMVNVTGRGNDTVEDAKAYIEGAGYTFPVFYDMELDAMYAFGVDAFPYTFFIDAEGYIMSYKIGTISAEALQAGIDLIR